MYYYTTLHTPAGNLLLVGDGDSLYGIYWEVFKRTPLIQTNWVEDAAKFKDVVRQLNEYFTGNRREFVMPIKTTGTVFQKSVWQEIARIPYGQTTSYQAIAVAVGSPKAVRAVGTAVGSNPFSIVVPCHRVLATSGKLGGYAGGLEAKKVLLTQENIPYFA